MQERRILNGLIDQNSIPSSAVEVTTANIDSTQGNVFYIPMYVTQRMGDSTTTVKFYINHVSNSPSGHLLSINNFPITGYLTNESNGGNSFSPLYYSGSDHAIMFSLPKTYSQYTYSTPSYRYYYGLYTEFNIYTSYNTYIEGSLLGFKNMVSEIIEEPDFKPYAVVKLSGQYSLYWVNTDSAVRLMYEKYPPIYIDTE